LAFDPDDKCDLVHIWPELFRQMKRQRMAIGGEADPREPAGSRWPASSRRLVADVLPARDPAAVVPFNRGILRQESNEAKVQLLPFQ
jgi:hypothetical protein